MSSNRHRCFNKIRKIFERTGVVLSHAEISYLCEHVLNANGEADFYAKYDEATKGMSRDEEKAWLEKVLKKAKRRKWLEQEIDKEIMAYV
jgi:hypothetical protein